VLDIKGIGIWHFPFSGIDNSISHVNTVLLIR
jgi:hypothetical protein